MRSFTGLTSLLNNNPGHRHGEARVETEMPGAASAPPCLNGALNGSPEAGDGAGGRSTGRGCPRPVSPRGTPRAQPLSPSAGLQLSRGTRGGFWRCRGTRCFSPLLPPVGRYPAPREDPRPFARAFFANTRGFCHMVCHNPKPQAPNGLRKHMGACLRLAPLKNAPGPVNPRVPGRQLSAPSASLGAAAWLRLFFNFWLFGDFTFSSRPPVAHPTRGNVHEL